jgi:hypothetical protein
MTLTYSLIFGVPAAVGRQGSVWSRRLGCQVREILASRLQKAATEPAENSSQFAVWSLNRILK